MPNTREKLIKLLSNAHSISMEAACFEDATYAKQLRMEADHLIANGVTVQQWIPVTEQPKENGIYCVIVENHKSRKVKKRTHARYKNGRWLDLYDNWENRCWRVALWMPLPEPPQGE